MRQLSIVVCCLLSFYVEFTLSAPKTFGKRSELSIFESYLNKLNTKLSKDASLNLALPFPNLDALLPPLWDEVLPLDSKHFSQDSEQRLEVDAWDYLQRMALYKYLVDNLQHCAWSKNTDSLSKPAKQSYNFGSILWGLPLQHGWQFSSGRLLTAPNSTVLTSSAWWADMNYYLSIIPYLGAVEAGVAPAIVLTTNPDPSRFCTSASACPDIVQPWKDFFVLLNTTADNCSSTGSKLDKSLTGTPIADEADFNLTYTMELLLDSIWKAHIYSISVGLPLFEAELQAMPAPEAQFGRAWAGLVDLIAETLFPCNNTITNLLQNCLPQRMLQEGDKAPFIQDMSRLENRAVWLIDVIYNANVTTNGGLEQSWIDLMCVEEGRALGRKMLAFGIYRPQLLVEYGAELVKLNHNIPSDTQCGVILAV